MLTSDEKSQDNQEYQCNLRKFKFTDYKLSDTSVIENMNSPWDSSFSDYCNDIQGFFGFEAVDFSDTSSREAQFIKYHTAHIIRILTYMDNNIKEYSTETDYQLVANALMTMPGYEFGACKKFLNSKEGEQKITVKDFKELQKLVEEKSKYRKMKLSGVKNELSQLYSLFSQDFENIVLKHWNNILKDLDNKPNLSDLVTIDVKTGKISFSMTLEPNKPWCDLRQTFLYFEDGQLKKLISNLEEVENLDNNGISLIEELKIRRRHLLDITEYSDLKLLVDGYHQIDKSNEINNNVRMAKLLQIAYLAKQSNDKSPNPTLVSLEKVATDKAKYLKLISKTNKYAGFVASIPTFHGVAHSIDKASMLERIHDIDPMHRDIRILFNIWHKLATEEEEQEEKQLPSFWNWLESQPESVLDNISVEKRYPEKYLPERVVVDFKDGVCCNPLFSEGSPSDRIADGVYLYNISADGKLRILPSPENFGAEGGNYSRFTNGAKGIKYDNKQVTFNHNSVTREPTVICAGCICFVNGKITEIDTNSGHYKPRVRQLVNALEYNLIPKDVFSNSAVICDYELKVQHHIKNIKTHKSLELENIPEPQGGAKLVESETKKEEKRKSPLIHSAQISKTMSSPSNPECESVEIKVKPRKKNN